MVPIYAIVSFLSYAYYWHAIYFEVIGDCYEAFAIASFFSLLCHYIAPDVHEQKEYFKRKEPKEWLWPLSRFKKCCGGDRGPWRRPRNGLTWFNVCLGLINIQDKYADFCRLFGSASINIASSGSS
jgi:hypothetical protein